MAGFARTAEESQTWPKAAWAFWSFITGLAGLLTMLVVLTRSEPRADWHPWPIALTEPLMFAVFSLPGAVIASRRPHNPAGWLLLVSGLGATLDSLGPAYTLYALSRDLPGGLLAAWVSNWAFALFVFPVFFLLLHFPDGRLPTPRWRPAAWFIGIAALLVVPCAALAPGPVNRDYFPETMRNPLGVPFMAFAVDQEVLLSIALVACPLVVSAASLLRRFVISGVTTRRQIEWVTFAVLVSVVLILATAPFNEALMTLAVDTAAVLLSASIGVAIVRRGLFDIERLLSRSVVYVALTIVLAALYTALVGLLELVMQNWLPGAASLLATAVVAASLQPLHGLLQRSVNRAVYGLRDDPYAVLTGLGRQLEMATLPEQVLPRAAETVAEALRLPYTAIELHGTGEDSPAVPAVRYGTAVRDTLRVPLVHQGEEVGVLVLGARAPGEPFTRGDARLLADVARHTAQAAAGVRLTLALLQSRQQLITTRAQERRLLGRELHDGVNSVLSEVVWSLQAALKWLRSDPANAEELLAAGLIRAHEGADAIRHISAGLRTSVDSAGLPAAVSAYLERFPLAADADLPEDLHELPAAVEEAAYWILIEALTNVLRHAHATRCWVMLQMQDNWLLLTISDNGRGLPDPLRPGVGLGSMRERATEIGGACNVRPRVQGGTEVVVHLPLTLA